MKQIRYPFLIVMSGAMMLGACTDPSQIGAGSANPKTQQGAVIGATAGALLGALSKGDGNRAGGAVKGAVIGGALGAGIGYSLDQQAADLRQDLGNDDVVITNAGDRLIVTLPQDILFATDSFAVRSDLRRDLQSVAGNLNAYPASTIQIIGHTDSDGDAAYNQFLSERRAGAVSDVLITSGVDQRRVRTIGRGESQPVASNLSASGKAQNRRVEIVILPNA